MRAIRKLSPVSGAVDLREVDRPVPEDREVLVAVDTAGVCGTDAGIYNWAGYEWIKTPVTLGHEFAGIVVGTGREVTSITVGDKVVALPNGSCGRCYSCQQGNRHICRDAIITGIHVDGGFADFATVPEDQLLVVPEDVPLPVAAMTEPTAVGVHATEDNATVEEDDNVVVQGVGPIGVLTALVVQKQSPESIVIIGTNADEAVRFPFVQDLGFETINVEDTVDLAAVYHDHTQGTDADIVFDATGHPRGIEQAIKLVRKKGAVIIVGTPHESATVNVSRIVRSEIQITGSFAARLQNFERALELLRDDIDVDGLTTTYQPTESTKTFEDMLDKRVVKPVFTFEGTDVE